MDYDIETIYGYAALASATVAYAWMAWYCVDLWRSRRV